MHRFLLDNGHRQSGGFGAPIITHNIRTAQPLNVASSFMFPRFPVPPPPLPVSFGTSLHANVPFTTVVPEYPIMFAPQQTQNLSYYATQEPIGWLPTTYPPLSAPQSTFPGFHNIQSATFPGLVQPSIIKTERRPQSAFHVAASTQNNPLPARSNSVPVQMTGLSNSFIDFRTNPVAAIGEYFIK